MDINSQYVTKSEFAQICGISISTTYKLLKSGRIIGKKYREGRINCYKIPIGEIARYLDEQEKKRMQPLREDEVAKLKKYYRTKMKDYPDVIVLKDIQTITGYGHEIIRLWIKSEKILGVVTRKKFKVAKEDLIDFFVSPYYSNIIRKSKVHIADYKEIGII